MPTDKENIPAERPIAELPTAGIIGMGLVGSAYAIILHQGYRNQYAIRLKKNTWVIKRP